VPIALEITPAARSAGRDSGSVERAEFQQDTTEFFARGRAEQSVTALPEHCGSREALRPERPS